MLRKRELALSRTMNFAQVLISLSVFCIVNFYYVGINLKSWYLYAMLAQIAILWTFILAKTGMGIIHRSGSSIYYVRSYVFMIGFGVGLLLLETLTFPHNNMLPHTKQLLAFGLLNFVVLVLFKFAFYYSMLWIRSRGYNSRNIVIVTNNEGQIFVDNFLKQKDWGYSLHSIVSYDKELIHKYDKTKFIGDNNLLKKYLQDKPIDDIFYCLPFNDTHYDLNDLLSQSKTLGVNLHIQQSVNIRKQKLFQFKDCSYDFNFVSHQGTEHNYFALKLKSFVDLLLSIVALLVGFPMMVVIALLIKLEDGGPIFFKQERIGLNGRRFNCFKFRTMHVNAEAMKAELEAQNEADGPVFKIENDPRITPIGKWLRKVSLDEFPQFLNVVRGDMSIVGPRPPLLKEVKQYTPIQLRRLSIKPGITCCWQVWGRHEVSFDEWMRMDLNYIDKWSVAFDFRIILATVAVVFKAKGS